MLRVLATGRSRPRNGPLNFSLAADSGSRKRTLTCLGPSETACTRLKYPPPTPNDRSPGIELLALGSEVLRNGPNHDFIDVYVGRLFDRVGDRTSDGFRRNGPRFVQLFDRLCRFLVFGVLP